uniref:Coordinator of PRMT5 and differentiation stimulator n=1 Tax=Otolemur garnettii TaxID=30611 RepID=H0WQ22_OTOGA
MDPQAAGARALGAVAPLRGPLLPSARKAPGSLEAGFATADHSGQERATEKATDRLGNGSRTVPSSDQAHFVSCQEEECGGWLLKKKKDMQMNLFFLAVFTFLPPFFNLSFKTADADDIQGSISQEVKPWVCCAPQGDMIYDPSWHHPPPLIPHYSKMVFETGQFDDAED